MSGNGDEQNAKLHLADPLDNYSGILYQFRLKGQLTMNVKEVVPFLSVSSMERSIRFYIDGLGFEMRHKWEPDGQIRWCWLTLGGASLMLQEFLNTPPPVPGGINLTFMCDDAIALYHDYRSRGLDPSEPEVGNGLWVTQLTDPDSFKLFFESPTDVPEDTKLSEVT